MEMSPFAAIEAVAVTMILNRRFIDEFCLVVNFCAIVIKPVFSMAQFLCGLTKIFYYEKSINAVPDFDYCWFCSNGTTDNHDKDHAYSKANEVRLLSFIE